MRLVKKLKRNKNVIREIFPCTLVKEKKKEKFGNKVVFYNQHIFNVILRRVTFLCTKIINYIDIFHIRILRNYSNASTSIMKKKMYNNTYNTLFQFST